MRLERLVTGSAERHPDRPAVKDEAGELTYEQLDVLSGRAATALRELGIRSGDRVAIWLSKSAQAVAVMQGALRIGAAYVPIDPMSPSLRASTIMRDCEISALVAPSDRARLIVDGDLAGVAVLSADDGPGDMTWSDLEQLDATSPSRSHAEDELAYILYTSGSTGVPKGVCISHRNALAFVEWAAREVQARPEDRFSNHAPFHFDLSVFDLYAAFLSGARVAIVPEQHAYVPGALVDFVVDEAITVWYAVPSALILMVDRGGLLDRPGAALRAVVFAGEPYPIQALRRLRLGLPGVRLFNWYGPTETNVCTGYEVKEIAPDREVPVPIGRAVSGDQVWAVREDGSDASVGEEGELVVAGPTVALGYWGRAPQADEPYRTGDLVRMQDDGDYVYVGRRDHMVKIRGHRVELGEVEAALLTHPEVAEAAVVAVGSGIEARLVAFIAGRRELALLEVKRHCAERLPRHMIVDRAVFVDELPRTRNGKVDRLELANVTVEGVTR
jgi:amino acid adenylation domain-containing protein